MAQVELVSKTSAGGAGNFNYEFRCGCAGGEFKPNITFTSANDTQATALATQLCSEACGEAFLTEEPRAIPQAPCFDSWFTDGNANIAVRNNCDKCMNLFLLMYPSNNPNTPNPVDVKNVQPYETRKVAYTGNFRVHFVSQSPCE